MSKDIDPKDFASAIMADILGMARGVGVEASNRIIDKAPVKSGGLKGSIKAGVNVENISFGEHDPTGESTKSSNESIISKAEAGDEINIIVGAPYGHIIEKGDASRQPVGFLLTTGEEYEAILNVAKETKDKYK